MRSTLAPAHFLRTDPSKKSVQWGSVKTGVLISGSGGLALKSGPPELLEEGVHSAIKSARIWLLTAWRGWKSSWNSTNSAAHLAILPVALELCRIALSGYEVTTTTRCA